jgi:hypothetical protein
MTEQNYLMVNESTNVVDNICVWDGDTNNWQPPQGYLMLVQATTPTLIWKLDTTTTPSSWALTEENGAGQLQFTWNTATQVLTTNEPEPKPPIPAEDQPTTSGVATI